MATLYDTDIIAWSLEQAALLRAQRWEQLDLHHIADEIESVARAERCEFESRVAVLLTHLLTWCYQPHLRRTSLRAAIDHQRRRVLHALKKSPSLALELTDPEWRREVWGEAVVEAEEQTELDAFPREPGWTVSQMLDPDFLPHGGGPGLMCGGAIAWAERQEAVDPRLFPD